MVSYKIVGFTEIEYPEHETETPTDQFAINT